MTEYNEAERAKAIAYQVIASLAADAGMLDVPMVEKALDYFAGLTDEEPLPFHTDKPE